MASDVYKNMLNLKNKWMKFFLICLLITSS